MLVRVMFGNDRDRPSHGTINCEAIKVRVKIGAYLIYLKNPFLSCLWKSERFKYFSACLIFSWPRLLERRFFNSLKRDLRE